MSSKKSHKKQLFYQQPQYSNGANHRSSSRQHAYTHSAMKKNTNKQSHSSSHKKGSLTLKNKLIDFLIKAAEIERKLQIIKETLCEEESFHPGSVFYRIDRERKGYLLERDVERFLVENGREFKGSELKMLYGKMNVDQEDAGVLLWKFQNFILPNQNPRLRYLATRRPVFIPLSDQRLSQKVQWLLSKLFVQIMKEEAKLQQINATLISSYDFRPKTVFELLANIDGYVTGESLNNFMVNEDCEVTIQEVGCLIKLIDKQGEGRVNFDDFKLFLATLGLKKEHEIFDELSPIPALKNFEAPLIRSIIDREGTLKQRVADNKMYRQSPQRRGLQSSGKIRRSRNQ